jgi:hypothetical protein
MHEKSIKKKGRPGGHPEIRKQRLVLLLGTVAERIEERRAGALQVAHPLEAHVPHVVLGVRAIDSVSVRSAHVHVMLSVQAESSRGAVVDSLLSWSFVCHNSRLLHRITKASTMSRVLKPDMLFVK